MDNLNYNQLFLKWTIYPALEAYGKMFIDIGNYYLTKLPTSSRLTHFNNGLLFSGTFSGKQPQTHANEYTSLLLYVITSIGIIINEPRTQIYPYRLAVFLRYLNLPVLRLYLDLTNLDSNVFTWSLPVPYNKTSPTLT